MFLVWIIPLLPIGPVIYAATGNNLDHAFKPASRCGQAAQEDWKTCPNCGQTL